MCDTQLIRQNNITFFAKNSDRESSEPQLITHHDEVRNDQCNKLRTTYITIPQVPNRFGLILSKPSWIWGAEIGINTQGVIIGNEAVFTKLVERKSQSLLGMDLLRLGLERGSTAREALETITQLLEEYGQAGPAGYRDKSFRYDNSFIIADANEAWKLETAGHYWVAKKVRHYCAISNELTIESDYDLACNGLEDFARKNNYYNGQGEFNFAKSFNTHFMSFMGKASERRALNLKNLKKLRCTKSASIESLIANLRCHQTSKPSGADTYGSEKNDIEMNFAMQSNRDICMHGGGLLRPSQSCGSMIAALEANKTPKIMVTGTSAPCLSLFKPLGFSKEDCQSAGYMQSSLHGSGTRSVNKYDSDKNSLWHQFEWTHRRALKDIAFRKELISSRNRVEQKLLEVYSSNLTLNEAHNIAMKWHRHWHDKARETAPRYNPFKPYDRYWKKLNRLDGISWIRPSKPR